MHHQPVMERTQRSCSFQFGSSERCRLLAVMSSQVDYAVDGRAAGGRVGAVMVVGVDPVGGGVRDQELAVQDGE